MKVDYSTPSKTMSPIGPYSHISRAGNFITIGAVAGVDPATGQIVTGGIEAETRQILQAFSEMLSSVGSDMDHILHINVFLKNMSHFDEMNAAYVSVMGPRRPARTVVSVCDVPKHGALLTMNLTAVVK